MVILGLLATMPFALSAVQWAGNGATTAWSDGGNWTGGEVPSATSTVELTGNATISLTSDCTASCITNTSGSPVTLTLMVDSDVRLNASICGDISVEKRGPGTLSLAARQSYAGTTRIIAGCISAVPDLSFSDYKKYGTLSVHLDSSHPETLVVDGNGDLAEWKSLTDNGVTVCGAAAVNLYPSVTYPHSNPSITASDPYAGGRSAVTFGYTGGGATRACTFIAVRKNGVAANFQARTLFFVQRQRVPDTEVGFLGMVKGYTFRFLRANGNSWNMANMNEAWANGRKASGTCTYEASAHTNLNLLVVRNINLASFEAIGTQYLIRDNGTAIGTSSSLHMDLHEVLLFDEALTDTQIEDISAILMQKWKIPKQAVCMNESLLSPLSTHVVDAGATLDCGTSIQTLAEVSGKGTLKAGGLIDLKGTTMKVNGGVSVTGLGAMTNTAAQAAMLVVSNNTAAALSVCCEGNINIEKQGDGSLWIVGGQKNSGEIRLAGGKLVGDPVLSRYGTLFVHLDASHPETLVVDGNGDLSEWKSLTDNGVTVYGADTAYPAAAHAHANPSIVTDSSGRTAVRFGETHGGTVRTNTFISARSGDANVRFNARTFFFVQRQRIPTSADAGFLGMIKGAAFRFLRSNVAYGWNPAYNMDEAWCNGRKATGTADCTFESSGITNANLLVVRRATAALFDIIGGQFLVRDNGTLTGNNSASLQMDFYEVALFDEALTDSQIEEISAILMQKWNIPQQVVPRLAFNGAIAPDSDFVVSGDAILDFAGFSPTVRALEFDATGTATVPVLQVVGNWDVTGIPLTMTGFSGKKRGNFLLTDGKLISPFTSVSGCDPDRIIYEAQSVRIRRAGFYLIVK